MREQSNDTWDALLARAEQLGRQRLWGQAEPLLRDVLETAPEHPAASRLLAEALRQQGRWTEAGALLEAQVARVPTDATAWAILASVRLGQGDTDACARAAQQALALTPESIAANRALALGRLRAGDIPAARQALEVARRLAPDEPEVLIAQGLLEACQGHARAAEASFRQVLASDPDHPEAKANLAPLLANQGEAVQALTLLGEALAIKPFMEGALQLKGKLLAKDGQFEAAAECFEQLLAVNPDHQEAQRRLAAIRRRVGVSADARRELQATEQELIEQPENADLWARRAQALHTLGRQEEARAACERSLALEATNTPAGLLLGQIHLQTGRVEDARMVLGGLDTSGPEGVDVLAALALADYRLERFSAAEATLRAAMQRAPGRADLATNLAETLRAAGRAEEARGVLEAALALDGKRPEMLLALGNLLQKGGDARAAIDRYEQALAAAPRWSRLRHALARAYLEHGRYVEAEALLREALMREPLNAGLHVNLGTVLLAHQRLGEAEQAYRRAIELDAGQYKAHFGLAGVYRHQFRLAESVASARQALDMRPDDPRILVNLGTALFEQGQVAEAIEAYEQAIACDPRCAPAWSNRMLSLNYLRPESPAVVAQAHFAFGAQFEDADDGVTGANPVVAAPPPARLHATGEALRVGYVSGDLYDHSCAYFIESLWRGHRREQVELFCYSHTRREDATTARLKALVDHWVPILGMSDAAVLKRVAMDGIDLLVDLNGHAGENRLPVFAKRAAPVQLNWLGYPNTTGLRNMDYRITDAWADPPGWTEPLHAETLVRLPGGFLCYAPDARAPAPAPPPVCGGRPLTFGCFNNPTKIGAETVAVWAQLLRALPGARMAFKARHLQDRGAAERLLKLFADQGVDASRLVLRRPQADKGEHLGTYNLIDIALDTFPYHGTTTTCEALWMGVPVITLAGEVHVSRVGVSLLKQVGLDALIALTPAEYIAKARALATDHARLTALRAGLRERMAASPLCDAERFAREMEAAYRWMCERQRADRLD